MKKTSIVYIILLFSALPISSTFSSRLYAQTATPTPDSSSSQNIQALQQQISDLESKVSDLKGQEQTLSNQIEVMDNNITLTQYRITATQEQIKELDQGIHIANNQISKLNGSVDELSKTLLDHIVASYEAGNAQQMQVLIGAANIQDYFAKASYLRVVQEHDKELLASVEQAKNDYAHQKQLFVTKQTQMQALQTQLEQYTKDLATEEDNKKTLLAQTQGSESNYEQLLAQAKAQLAGFSRFVTSQGGASLLSGQTVCDDWGCYYNQRDSQWGNIALDGTQYSIASDGCLMTDVAMVFTHYGHKSVTPLTINSNSGNFASYEPAWLLKSASADGATLTRSGIGVGDIDGELSQGHPVIVGISYDAGPLADHFVTLISGSNGSYQMNDPYVANGHNVSFTDHYSMGSIREVDRVTVQ